MTSKASSLSIGLDPRSGAAGLVALFSGTLFTSAFLLFWIQPLFAKLTLPLLGGSTAVWTTAMVFFQATLLAGYGYAHLSSRHLKPPIQLGLHAVILGLVFLTLPVAIRAEFRPGGQPILDLLQILTVSIGLPFFAVASTAPLLQRWFSHTHHKDSEDPYFLYGASNVGSILALVAFPFVMEPQLRLAQQSVLWSAGYGLLAVLILSCGAVAYPRGRRRPAQTTTPSPTAMMDSVTWRARSHWIILAFVPSSLLLGVTNHITLDLAPVPLLWVVPLALYLLTFVIAFSRSGGRVRDRIAKAQPYILAFALLFVTATVTLVKLSIGIHLAVFFILALVCHGELVRHRPVVSHLTEFYFFMSLGGVLGGMFNAIAAPLVFNGIYEYPLAIVLACGLRPGIWGGSLREKAGDVLWPLLLWAAVFMIEDLGLLERLGFSVVAAILFYRGLLAVVVFGFNQRPLRYGLGAGVALLVIGGAHQGLDVLYQERSFFGVYRVIETEDGKRRELRHGTTTHGIQAIDEADWREPLGYHERGGPLGQIIAALEARGSVERIGLVGLGAGASLCYAQPGQRWTFYEIDPLVVEIAWDERFFHYGALCFDQPASEMRVGDARLTLAAEPDAAFDLLILDAYNSDAVPVHLLTREAMALYVSQLKPGGMLAMQASNRHLNIPRVIAGLAADAGLTGWLQRHRRDPPPPGFLPSDWAVVTRPGEALPFVTQDARWEPLETIEDTVLWTDDFSNIISVLK
jgi:spermidine synthase